jgi:hypothetical protein
MIALRVVIVTLCYVKCPSTKPVEIIIIIIIIIIIVGGGEIFSTCPDRPWGPPSPLYNGYRFIPGSKANGAWS